MSQVIRSPKTYDVCIIGSGAAGGTAAKVLTEGGLSVVMLEAGPPLDPAQDYKEHLWPYDLAHRGIGVGGKARHELNDEFLYCASLCGTWALELMAARSYLDRLMENARVVRYLAQNFPEQLAKLQTILDIPMGREALAQHPKRTGRKRKHLVF